MSAPLIIVIPISLLQLVKTSPGDLPSGPAYQGGADVVNRQVRSDGDGGRQRCWYCTLPIQGEASIGIPLTKDEEGRFHSVGQFHGHRCAWTYLNDVKNPMITGKNRAAALLVQDYRAKGGKGAITPMPPKEQLREYGGDMEPEEYMTLMEEPNMVSAPHISPHVPLKVNCERYHKQEASSIADRIFDPVAPMTAPFGLNAKKKMVTGKYRISRPEFMGRGRLS